MIKGQKTFFYEKNVFLVEIVDDKKQHEKCCFLNENGKNDDFFGFGFFGQKGPKRAQKPEKNGVFFPVSVWGN